MKSGQCKKKVIEFTQIPWPPSRNNIRQIFRSIGIAIIVVETKSWFWFNKIIQSNSVSARKFYLRAKVAPCFRSHIFSAECTIGMVRGLTPLKHYGAMAIWQ